MAVTPINSEDRLVQATVAKHLEQVLDWESVYAWNKETFVPGGTLGRADTKGAVLTRDLRVALERLNPDLPASAIDDALRALTVYARILHCFRHLRSCPLSWDSPCWNRYTRESVPKSFRIGKPLAADGRRWPRAR